MEEWTYMDYQTRYQKRKKKRVNRILNVLIGVVALLIIYFSSQLFFNSNEKATVVNSEETIENEEDENQPKDDIQEEKINTENENKIEDEKRVNEKKSEKVTEEEEIEPTLDSNWHPTGTVQSEPFEADFTEGSINWQEMTNALKYATGLGDNIIIWRLGNDGNLQSAIGTVSDWENRSNPYQVRMRWVPYEGWLPIEVLQLEENPFHN